MTLDVFVPGPPAFSTAMEDITYTVTPVSVKVQAGIVTGEIADIQVVKRVEPRLMGTLRLRNTKLADVRTDASFPFSTYGSDRLDPGQEVVQAVDVACPSQALEAGQLKGLRSFAVSIGSQ